MTNGDIKYCPFCGGYKVKLDSKTKVISTYDNNIYCREYTMSVRCNKCHGRCPTINGIVYERTTGNEEGVYRDNVDTIKKKSKKEVYGLHSELERLAIKKWNNRLFEFQ